MPHSIKEGYQDERQDEGKEYAQPELKQPIRSSLLGYIINTTAIIGHWAARVGWLIVKLGSRCGVPHDGFIAS
jgi:hypothetical protein